jgi:hypothetical protein
MDLQAAIRAASEAAARIDAKSEQKLLELALKHGMTKAEAAQLAKALKQAA